MISPNVLKCIHEKSIIEFLKDNNVNIEEKLKQYEIDIDNPSHPKELLNILILNKELNDKEINDFLINELNYGILKNVFVRFIDSCLVKNLDDAIKRINSLKNRDIEGAEQVESEEFCYEIRKHVDVGKRRLIYSKVDCKDNIINKINLIIAEGIRIGKELDDRSNNYYAIEIDLMSKYVIIKVRNWGGNALNDYNPDKIYSELEGLIIGTFGIIFNSDNSKYQKAIYSIVQELTNKALEKASEKIDSIIKDDIDKQVESWWKNVFDDEISIKESDKKIITNSILNSFYKYFMKKTYGVIKRNKMVQELKLYAYPQRVWFVDDTIGEGKAISPEPNISLFDTAVFYDLKARFDYCKEINYARLYWLDCDNHECFGTTIHTERANLYKIIFMPHRIDKEMVYHVLQKIKRSFES